MEYIDLNIEPTDDGIKKIGAFCISDETQRLEYESIINNQDFKVIEEGTPSMDKTGRVIIVLKWLEPH